MRVLLIVFLLIAAAIDATARDIHVFIAPRSYLIPRSGKMVFDIFWVNRGSRSASIPGAGPYSFICAPLEPDSNWAVSDARRFSHPVPDRQIAAGAIIRDIATVELETRSAKFLRVTAHFFSGQRAEFESNSVVLRAQR